MFAHIALHALTLTGRMGFSTSILDEMNRGHGHLRDWRYLLLVPEVFEDQGR